MARKKYVDDKVASSGAGTLAAMLFLSKTGGTMSGNIVMGNNIISTTADPTGDTDLSRKKYVDDQNTKKLSITGGTMSSDIVLGNNKIITTLDPTDEKHLARKNM